MVQWSFVSGMVQGDLQLVPRYLSSRSLNHGQVRTKKFFRDLAVIQMNYIYILLTPFAYLTLLRQTIYYIKGVLPRITTCEKWRTSVD